MKITTIILLLLAIHVSIAFTASSKTKTTTTKTSTTTMTSTSTTNATKTNNSTNGMMGPPSGNNTNNGTMGPPPGNSTNNGTMMPPPGNGTNGTMPMGPPPARNDTNSSSSSSRILNTKDQENEESLLPDGFLDIVYEYPSAKEDDTVCEEEMSLEELPQMERDGSPLDMPPPKPRGRKELPKMRGPGNFRGSN